MLCALAPVDGAQLGYHLFTIVLDAGIERDPLRAVLTERGIQTSVHYPPVHGFSIYADRAWDLQITDAYGARAVSLPMFATMTEAQQGAVVDALHAALGTRPAARA